MLRNDLNRDVGERRAGREMINKVCTHNIIKPSPSSTDSRKRKTVFYLLEKSGEGNWIMDHLGIDNKA